MQLEFTWNAILKDGSQINQFNKDGIETRFKSVKDNFDNLAFFNLTNNKGILFTVDLINGSIGYNSSVLPHVESKENKKNIRLIFFSRHTVKIGMNDLKTKSHIVTYYLGIQWTKKNDINRNIILQINQNGDFIINAK